MPGISSVLNSKFVLGAIRGTGNLSGQVAGAAAAYDLMLSSNLVRYGIMGTSAAAGLWGMSGDDGLFSVRGAIGAAGMAGAAFTGAGALMNGNMNAINAWLGAAGQGAARGAFTSGFGAGAMTGNRWAFRSGLATVVPRAVAHTQGAWQGYKQAGKQL